MKIDELDGLEVGDAIEVLTLSEREWVAAKVGAVVRRVDGRYIFIAVMPDGERVLVPHDDIERSLRRGSPADASRKV